MAVTKNPSKDNSTFGDGERDVRRTVIPAPRRDGMFSGWGVRF